jgi:hypothetical protein
MQTNSSSQSGWTTRMFSIKQASNDTYNIEMTLDQTFSTFIGTVAEAFFSKKDVT